MGADRVDFDGFIKQLEAEIAWIAELHRRDRSGQAASDIRSIRRLIVHAELVGRALGLRAALTESGRAALEKEAK